MNDHVPTSPAASATVPDVVYVPTGAVANELTAPWLLTLTQGELAVVAYVTAPVAPPVVSCPE